MKFPRYALLTISLLAAPALAQVTVTAPAAGTTVTSPATFVATSTTTCSLGVASMGVYIDNQLSFVSNGTTLNAAVPITLGPHNTVVEEWDYCGGATFTPINNLTVIPAANPPGIPANAIASGDINASTIWQWGHDYGTPGSSVGSTNYPVTGLSTDNTARSFAVSYSHRGGEIYHAVFGSDSTSANFVYDTNIYVADPTQTANIEMDINQVIANGATMILGAQCSVYSGTWEYVTIRSKSPHWNPSNLPCNPETWTANTWHHVQIASHHDQSGNVTYDWVNLDGVYGYFANATGYDALFLGWAPGALVLNFQLDGASPNSGTMNVYTDQLNIYRW